MIRAEYSESGHGPAWTAPPYVTPLKKWLEKLVGEWASESDTALHAETPHGTTGTGHKLTW